VIKTAESIPGLNLPIHTPGTTLELQKQYEEKTADIHHPDHCYISRFSVWDRGFKQKRTGIKSA